MASALPKAKILEELWLCRRQLFSALAFSLAPKSFYEAPLPFPRFHCPALSSRHKLAAPVHTFGERCHLQLSKWTRGR